MISEVSISGVQSFAPQVKLMQSARTHKIVSPGLSISGVHSFVPRLMHDIVIIMIVKRVIIIVTLITTIRIVILIIITITQTIIFCP